MINEEFLRELNLDEDTILKILSNLNEDLERENFQNTLKDEITSLNPYDTDLVLSLFNTEGLKLEDGKIEGLAEKLQAFKDQYPFLFITPDAPKIIASTKASEQYTKEDFNKMGYTEKSRLYQKNPSLYKKLANA